MRVSINKLVKQITLVAMATTALTIFSGTAGFISSSNFAVAQEEAEKPKRKTRRTPAMREKAFRKLESAQSAIELKDYETVVEELEDLRTMRGLNSFEEAQLWNFYAFYYFEIEQVRSAIESYEKILQLEGIPIQFEDTIRYQLAQLYFSEGEVMKSLDLLNQWFAYAVEPQASAYEFMGNIKYTLEEYDEALVAFLKAIELTELTGGKVKENWLQLIRSIYYEKKDYPNTPDVLERLAIEFPKATYWLQLAAIYSELGDEASQLATMEVAYYQDYLTEDKHLINLAQLYMFNEVPIKASEVMKKGFDEEIIPREEKHLELYANSLIYAKEFEDSIAPLKEAANLSEEGNLSLRLGQVYIERDRWALAISALKQAIDKGELDREDQTYMVLGMAYFNNDQLSEAKKAFQTSRKDRRSRKSSAQWIKYIDNEINRREQLRASAQE